MIQQLLQPDETLIGHVAGKGDSFTGGGSISHWEGGFKGTVYVTNKRVLLIDKNGLLNRSYSIGDVISMGMKKAVFSNLLLFEFAGNRSFIFRSKTDLSELNSIVIRFNEVKASIR